MSFSFDSSKLEREVEKLVEKKYWDAIERAKRSIGADGQLVKVTKLATPRRQGSNITYGSMSFPSADLKRRFEAALKREFR